MTEREAFIALNRITGLGSITVKRLIESLGSAAAIFDAGMGDLLSIRGLGAERARQLRKALDVGDFNKEVERAAELGVELVTQADDAYPSLLRQIFDPPLALYVRGDLQALQGTAVAVVGTRHPTIYGRESAQGFGFQLAGAGVVVVSGLARGIDTAAHRGALHAQGRTLAVLGGAIDRLYPAENRSLAEDIARQGGAVISEYPFGRSPDRQTFPMRNRIVSGLSAGVLVVEASLTSGTLITVDQALEQGRVVMAVPGRIDSTASQGCHKLLRNGARLVTCADDVAEEIGQLIQVPPMLPRSSVSPVGARLSSDGSGLGADESRLLAAVDEEERSVDDLVRISGLDAGKVNGLLVGLRIKRRVTLLPGGMVKKTQVGRAGLNNG